MAETKAAATNKIAPLELMDPYITTEEREQLNKIEKEWFKLTIQVNNLEKEILDLKLDGEIEEAEEKYLTHQNLIQELTTLADNKSNIFGNIEQRYINHFNKDTDALINDCRIIIDAVDLEGFNKFIETQAEILTLAKQNLKNRVNKTADDRKRLGAATQLLAVYGTKNYRSFTKFLLKEIRVQLNALAQWGLEDSSTNDEINKLIVQKAKEYYKDPIDFIIEEDIIDPFETIKVNTHAPNDFIIPIDKITNSLDFIQENAGAEVDVKVSRKGSKNEVKTAVRIMLDGLKGLDIDQRITPFDMEVLNAITTLYVVAGNEYITCQMVYQALTGDKKARATDKKRALINDSFTRLMYCKIEINSEAEKVAFKYNILPRYDAPLIQAERLSNIEINGTKTDCIRLLQAPTLYRYANSKNQIARVPITLLNTPVSKTEETIVLQGFLIKRIEAIKSTKGRISNNILYESIYELLEATTTEKGAIPTSIRTKQKDIRKKTKDILGSFKENGFISSYKENTKNGKYYSVSIF